MLTDNSKKHTNRGNNFEITFMKYPNEPCAQTSLVEKVMRYKFRNLNKFMSIVSRGELPKISLS